MLLRKTMKKYKKPPAWRGIVYYLRCFARRRPNWVNIEVTKRCNAKCNHCSYWEDASPPELADYTDIVKAFRPVVLSLSGGEPLVRKDIADVIRKLRPYCHYVALVTNGVLLNEAKAEELFAAGVNQLSVSLDFLNDKHDVLRGVPGLFEKIKKTVPPLAAKGYNMAFNTVIMHTNLDEIIPIALAARDWGVAIAFSTYCNLKNDNNDHVIQEESIAKLENIVKELKSIKRKYGHIKNSDHYLDGILKFVKDGGVPNCQAGKRWVQVTPDGHLQPCSELPRYARYDEYSRDKVPAIDCTKCWFACRGEAEANFFHPRRLLELIKT